MIQHPQHTASIAATHSAAKRSPTRVWVCLLAFALMSSASSASEEGVAPSDESQSANVATELVNPPQKIPDIPVAENVDLKAPAPAALEPVSSQPDGDSPSDAQLSDTDTELAELEPAVMGRSIVVLDTEIPPATSSRLSWGAQESFDGIAAATPVLVVNGAEPGPVLCVTAAVHGDELNGIEMVRSLLYNIDPNKLKGTLIGVPIVNLDGFRRNSRYLTDRRDLNRFFPGNPQGSAASRIAHSFFNEVILHCEVLVDLHTGSFHRSNLPQLRADLKNEDVRALTEGFGGMVVLHSRGAKGTLRRAATRRGIPSVTLEAGEPLRLQKKAVNRGVKGLRSLLSYMEMYGKRSLKIARAPNYYKSQWVRADQGGVLFAEVSLGERVKEGELLGTVTDPITNVRSEMLAPANGRILGMALNQVLMPGFATFRIGIETSEQEILTAKAPAAPIIKVIDQDVEVVELGNELTDEQTASADDTDVVAVADEDGTLNAATQATERDEQNPVSDTAPHVELPSELIAADELTVDTPFSDAPIVEAPIIDESRIEESETEDSSIEGETAVVTAPATTQTPPVDEVDEVDEVSGAIEKSELVELAEEGEREIDDLDQGEIDEDPDYPVAEE